MKLYQCSDKGTIREIQVERVTNKSYWINSNRCSINGWFVSEEIAIQHRRNVLERNVNRYKIYHKNASRNLEIFNKKYPVQ